MARNKIIIAVGGGGFTHSEDFSLDEFIINQKNLVNYNLGFLPTASKDDKYKTDLFYKRFENYKIKVSHFNLLESLEGFKKWISKMDIIYIGGGNTKFMLDFWRENNLLDIFKEAYENGKILSGVSAGAACWFEWFLTDSDGLSLKPMKGIGLLPGSFTPHYSEKERSDKFKLNIKNSILPSGIAIDDGVGVLFIDGKPTEVYSSRKGHDAYLVKQNKQISLKDYIKKNYE